MTISLQLDQVLRALANTEGVGMKCVDEPAYESDKGKLYSSYVAGVNELFYMDGYGAATQITTNGQLNPGEITITLNQAYTGSGSGAGRIITANAGPVQINASGGNAAYLDGYMTLLKKTSDPTNLANRGLLYVKDLSGAVELFYVDAAGNALEISKAGSVYVTKIQDRTVSSAAPTDGYALTWNTSGNQWISSKPIPGGTAGGDLSGTYPNPTVDGLQGRSVSSSAPTDGYALTWNAGGAQWESSKPVPGGTAGGDLSGTYPNPTVAGVQNRQVSSALPIDGYALVWNDGLSQWEPQRILVVDEKVRVSATDTTPAFLEQKVIAGNNIELTKNGVGANETLTFATPQVLKLAEQGANPAPFPNDGYLFSKDVDGYTELFYLDNFGTATQITSDGYLDTLNSLRGVGMYSQTNDPPYSASKGVLYTKDVGGVSEFFYQDSEGARLQLSKAGQINPDILTSYAPKTLLDAYATEYYLLLYAEKSLLDSYATVDSLSTYAEKSLLDSYAVATTYLNPTTLAGLASVVTTGLPSGAQIYVTDVDSVYEFEPSGSYTADGLTVINGYNDGYWVSEMVGRWDDVLGDVSQGNGAGALTYEAFRDTPYLMYFMRHDQDDSLHFRFQFPHRWKRGTDVKLHVHILPCADPASNQDIYFDGYYAWSTVDGTTVPANASWTGFNATEVVANGDIYKQKIVNLASITPPSGAKESAFLLVYLRRKGTSASDTYTTNKGGGTPAANVGLLGVDVHFQVNKIGTVTEIPV